MYSPVIVILCFSVIGISQAYPVDDVNIYPVKNEKESISQVQANSPSSVDKNQKQGQQGQQGQNLAVAQTNFIGSNVVKVVQSSLTGNAEGIFSGALNLLNTNNRVNNLFGGFRGSTLPSPIANAGNNLIFTHSTTVATTAAAATSASASSTEDEDEEEEYEEESVN